MRPSERSCAAADRRPAGERERRAALDELFVDVKEDIRKTRSP